MIILKVIKKMKNMFMLMNLNSNMIILKVLHNHKLQPHKNHI